MNGGVQLYAPVALSPGKEPPYTHWIGGWGTPELVWIWW